MIAPEIKLYQIPSFQRLKTLTGKDPTFSPDGQLITVSNDGREIKLYQIPSFQCLKTLTGKNPTFSPDGQLITVSNDGREIKLYRMPDCQLLTVLTGKNPTFSPDGQLLAVLKNDGREIKLYRMPDCQLLTILTGKNPTFSPDGKILSSCCSKDGTIKLWQMPDSKPLATLDRYSGHISDIAFSPDGRILASCSRDGTIKLWQMPNGKPLATLASQYYEKFSSVTFSSDGLTLVSLSTYELRDCLYGGGQGGEIQNLILWKLDLFRQILDLYQARDKPVEQLSPEYLELIHKTLQSHNISLVNKNYLQDQILLKEVWKHLQKIPGVGDLYWSNVWFIQSYMNDYANYRFRKISKDAEAYLLERLTSTNNGYDSHDHLDYLIETQDEDCNFFIKYSAKALDILNNKPLYWFKDSSLFQLENYGSSVCWLEEGISEKLLWLEFMQALINWHRRFDVEVEDAPKLVSTGEFDIEIEG